uniref:Pre-mRNA-splicing factor Syf1/CRNKL1-like C-terminal HAT-repeats domain-containing protein n=1 Tax=Eutreptiella gymnastica TaxID=73025 RepID=A0A7S4G382_9EUGL
MATDFVPKLKKSNKKRKVRGSVESVDANALTEVEVPPIKKAKKKKKEPKDQEQSKTTNSDKKQLPRATITTVTDTHSTKDDGMFVPFGDAGDVVADAVPAPNETLKAPKANKKEMAAERRKEQWLKRLSEEQRVDAVEAAHEANPTPATPEEFRMLLAGSPNSSFLWCQFMAFWLFRGQIEKARQVAELALTTINFREEQEIFNVWVAYLNLESQHGTRESTDGVFRRAIKNVDQEKKMYQHQIRILYKAGHHGQVFVIYKEMVRKFHIEVDVWVQFYKYCIERNRVDELKQIPKNALNSLMKDQHVQMMTQIAAAELREGSVDRGRAIFEGLVSKFPKRGDIWSVYIDLERLVQRRAGNNLPQLRNIFDRVTTLSLSPKVMQGFLTRYMELEKEYGTQQTQQQVHDRAVQYVDQKCAQ